MSGTGQTLRRFSAYDFEVSPAKGAGVAPILAYANNEAFDPDATQAMSAAFDGAWQSLRDTGHIATAPFRAEATRARLARCILELARSGERDPSRLKEYAIKGLTLRD